MSSSSRCQATVYLLLLTPFLAVPLEGCRQPEGRIVLIAEGGWDWRGEAASRVLSALKATLNGCHAVEVARFDAAPTLRAGWSVRGANRDLIFLRPGTPMREAMEIAFIRSLADRKPQTMVVVANRQSRPTIVSTARLLQLARLSKTRVYTIHLRSGREGGRVFRRLSEEIARAAGALGAAESGDSARDTARLLELVAHATGGKACVAAGEGSWTSCANAMATEILGSHGE